MSDEKIEARSDVAEDPQESEHPLAIFMRPSLRLSKRQKVILGLHPKPGPPSEKQKLRNEAAGARLKKYHETRRQARAAATNDITTAIETIANVSIVKKDKAPRVQIKKQPPSKLKRSAKRKAESDDDASRESESESESESELLDDDDEVSFLSSE